MVSENTSWNSYEAMGDLYLKNGSKVKNLSNSNDHETSPYYDSKSRKVYYATWNDKEMGAVYQMDLSGKKKKKITSIPSQYGSIIVSQDGVVAYLRGAGSLVNGNHLERQKDFELVLNEEGSEKVLASIAWSGYRYGIRPRSIYFGKNNKIYFSDYVEDILTLKSISTSGLDEKEIYKFPHATRAIISPNMEWIAFREYHRSFVTPFEYFGKAVSISAEDNLGFTQRVDRKHDGDFMSWSSDSKTLLWTRGKYHYEKSLNAIIENISNDADISSNSMFINRAEGNFYISQSRALISNPIKLETSEASMRWTGEVLKNSEGLLNELNLDLDMMLRVSENIPWYAAIFGGIPALAGGLVIENIFEDSLDNVSTFKFKVTGSVDNPIIDRLD